MRKGEKTKLHIIMNKNDNRIAPIRPSDHDLMAGTINFNLF